ncbi:unnamed protein product [Rotaria magnacalcarata]|uniref:Protein kinase C-binding protein 1 n=4 Tax=Rotaria magnacalcarata TaxID=392030 RepID=A0A816NYC3_9BILA|nr:unnamed protein product [Rotaria magnacalcarata]
MDLQQNSDLRLKLNKTNDENNHHDIYCFECHHVGQLITGCDSCPRVYHSKCLGLSLLPEKHWICPECEVNQTTPLQRHSINELNRMLKYALDRLKSHPQAKHFIQSMDEIPDYLDYIIHPIDLVSIEKNINLKRYCSTDAFIGDIKWIVHNNQSKLTNIARTFLKITRHEMTEIELCSECYLRSTQVVSTDWFTKPCSIPHTLCWAKMKGYQPWPAKVLRIINDEVDVRFFGQHDRARIPLHNCFVLSKEYPGSEKKKFNSNFEASLIQLQIHIDQLKSLYGHFTYAPLRTSLSKTKPFTFVSIIDDSMLPSYMTVAHSNYSCRSSDKYSKHPGSSTESSSSSLSQQNVTKRAHENSQQSQKSIKRQRTSHKHCHANLISTDDNELQSTLNVFDILNQSNPTSNLPKADHEITAIPFKLRSISPTDNKLRIQALLRKYIPCKSPAVDHLTSEVRFSMNELLDSIEALESLSDVGINLNILPTENKMLEQSQLSDKHIRTRKSRKSNLQHRIIPKNTHSKLITCLSLDQSLSTSLPFVPLRPLSVSPPNYILINSFESIPFQIPDNITIQQSARTPSFELLNIKSEPIDQDEHQLSHTSSPFLISSSSSSSQNTNVSLPIIIPIVPHTSQIPTTVPSEFISSPALSMYSSASRPKNTTNRRLESSIKKQSNSMRQSRHVSNTIPMLNYDSMRIPQHTNQFLLDDHQKHNEIQTIINSFHNQLQQLFVDLNNKIESSLQITRKKYEKDLEDTRRSFRMSLVELHTITNEQIQEIHTSLELQYWKRLADMRNRYESKLQCE